MKQIIAKILNLIFGLLKVDEKKIVFESGRNLVDGNPRALYAYIKENCPEKFRVKYLVNKETDISMLDPKDVIYYKTLKSYYHLATAKFWIKSQSMGSLLKKKPNQVYIQTWHGAGALKKMGYDITEPKERKPIGFVLEWDYFIASDEENERTMRTATGYDKKSLILGTARTDEIIKLKNDKNFINKVKKDLNIDVNDKRKIVLYCPTFRDKELYGDGAELKIKKLSEIDDILVLMRLHPLVRERIDKSVFKGNIINAGEYPDVQDLLIISDMLISDYSSIIFDYALLKRPIILYTYDLEEYITERNGFYLDYKEEMPGPIVYNEEELYDTVKNIDNIYNNYQEKLDRFNEKYNKYHDGKACERLIEFMENYK